MGCSTIEWLDPGQVQLPPHMLAVDLAEISYEERVFVAWCAQFMIDTLYPLPHSVPNQLFCKAHAIVLEIRSPGTFEV